MMACRRRVSVAFWATGWSCTMRSRPTWATGERVAARHARPGSVVGALAPGASAGASAEPLGLADARAAAVVERAAPAVVRLLARGTRTSLIIGAGTAALGAVLFVASSPGAGRAAAFWHPLRAMVDARAPVRLAVEIGRAHV